MSYALWKAERHNPTPEERRGDRTTEPVEMLGYWRIIGARTKPDFPLAIWALKDDETGEYGVVRFKFGRKNEQNIEDDRKSWDEFVTGHWLKTVAVTKEAWEQAIETGYWPAPEGEEQGKPARNFTVEEKAGVSTVKTTPAAEGGNQADDEPQLDEDGNAIDETYVQVSDNLTKALDAARKLGPITTIEKANEAAGIIELLSNNGKIGEARRKEEKKPHDDAAEAVQAKWVPILKPASDMIADLKRLIQKFKDEEEAKRREAARIEREKEQKRIADERAAALAAEAEKTALATGEAERSPEDIAAQAAAEAAAEMAQAPQADTTVRVGTAHGRAIGVGKKKVGVIEDVDAFLAALRPAGAFAEWPDSNDFKAWLQDKANKLARADTAFAGMKIDKV